MRPRPNARPHLTAPGDLVVDFFGGSFGAAVVCQQTRRQYRGCDTDEGCVNIGRRRLQEVGADISTS